MNGADSSSSNLQACAYLWDGSEDGWVLLRAEELAGGYCIFDRFGSGLLHVEDGDLYRRFCDRMRAAGCEVLTEVPQVEVKVDRAV